MNIPFYMDAAVCRCEVKGKIIFYSIYAMENFSDMILSILNDNGIDTPDPDEWYPQLLFINILLKLQRATGEYTLSKIGRTIIQHSLNQLRIKNIKDALSSLPYIFSMFHRGGGADKLDLFMTSSSSAVIITDSPYPTELLYGMLQFIGSKYRSKGTHVSIAMKKGYLYGRSGDLKTRRFIISW